MSKIIRYALLKIKYINYFIANVPGVSDVKYINNIPRGHMSLKKKYETIQRASHKNNYFIMNRFSAQDKKLSWAATGLLTYLLSLPNDWKIVIDELGNHKTSGRDNSRSAFKELIQNKYIYRHKTTEKGLQRYINFLFEVPYDENSEEFKLFLPDAGFPRAGGTAPRSASLNYNNIQNTQDKYIVQNPPSPLSATPTVIEPKRDFFFSLEEGKFLGIEEKDLKRWRNVYTSIDITKEISKAEEWCLANVTKAKLKKKWREFLRRWFEKSNDREENKQAYRSQYNKQATGEKTSISEEDKKRQVLFERIYEGYQSFVKNTTDPYWANHQSLVLENDRIKIYGTEIVLGKATPEKFVDILEKGRYVPDFHIKNLKRLLVDGVYSPS